MKTLFLAALLTGPAMITGVAMSSRALAQSADQDAAPGNGSSAGIRSGNITSTGATVPNPGASQSAGTTDLDRGIQRQDNKIESSICKGC